jgi:hypothetical protein
VFPSNTNFSFSNSCQLTRYCARRSPQFKLEFFMPAHHRLRDAFLFNSSSSC